MNARLLAESQIHRTRSVRGAWGPREVFTIDHVDAMAALVSLAFGQNGIVGDGVPGALPPGCGDRRASPKRSRSLHAACGDKRVSPIHWWPLIPKNKSTDLHCVGPLYRSSFRCRRAGRCRRGCWNRCPDRRGERCWQLKSPSTQPRPTLYSPWSPGTAKPNHRRSQNNTLLRVARSGIRQNSPG
ncbi:MAG: hypothetical protein KatS3mg111_4019 [Pirellulaceae bacterium]|nr:MAG: hypothetical protein KatS3mg111_4019 [Pirellulaceae bacterium]